MKLGAYTACLHDRSLDDTLKILGELGLTSAEINTGGFIAAPHIPIDELLTGGAAREDYLGRFAQAGITPTLVENGRQALEAWESQTWDIILMDIQMPIMDGVAATLAIREREAQTGRTRTPIIGSTPTSR